MLLTCNMQCSQLCQGNFARRLKTNSIRFRKSSWIFFLQNFFFLKKFISTLAMQIWQTTFLTKNGMFFVHSPKKIKHYSFERKNFLKIFLWTLRMHFGLPRQSNFDKRSKSFRSYSENDEKAIFFKTNDSNSKFFYGHVICGFDNPDQQIGRKAE